MPHGRASTMNRRQVCEYKYSPPPKSWAVQDRTKFGGIFIVDSKVRFRDSEDGPSLSTQSPHVEPSETIPYSGRPLQLSTIADAPTGDRLAKWQTQQRQPNITTGVMFHQKENWSRFEGIDVSDPHKYSEAVLKSPHLEAIREDWSKKLDVPFYGVTNDGKRREGLYQIRDEGAPTRKMVEAARRVLDSLSPSEKADTVHDLDSDTWSLTKLTVRKIIDEGLDKGLTLCANEGQLGLQLMQSLPPELQRKAQIYPTMKDPAMPEGRWNPADQRHMAGAFQDNRVIPYEGVVVTDMSEEQQILVMAIVHEFLALWPYEPLRHRLKQILKHLTETHFCWIGGFGEDDPFYYRIQSPVALFEFDHHSGVFLTNKEPAKYHIHTIQRLPNGNDYGRALRELLRPR
ncbi:hypothetical protein Landi51_06059 [Colletotrichum acutatum]